jgi:hypothetical protein
LPTLQCEGDKIKKFAAQKSQPVIAGRQMAAAFSMGPHGPPGRCAGRDPTCEKAIQDYSKTVPGASGRESGRATCKAKACLTRRGDDRLGCFQNDDGAELTSRLTCGRVGHAFDIVLCVCPTEPPSRHLRLTGEAALRAGAGKLQLGRFAEAALLLGMLPAMPKL